jgi:hypothetical protein
VTARSAGISTGRTWREGVNDTSDEAPLDSIDLS